MAVLSGGPTDRREHSIESENLELCVVMTDDSNTAKCGLMAFKSCQMIDRCLS